MGKKRVLFLTLIPLIIFGLFFGLTIMIPAVSSKKISIGYSVSDASSFGSADYRVKLVEGQTYSIDCDTNSFWGLDVSLFLYHTPFRIVGIKVDSVSLSGDQFHFTAEKTATYYIKLKGVGMGFYDFSVTETSVANSATPENYINVGRLLLFIIPFVVILAFTIAIGSATRKKSDKKRRIKTPMERAQRSVERQEKKYSEGRGAMHRAQKMTEKQTKRAEEDKGFFAGMRKMFQNFTGTNITTEPSPYLQKAYSSNLPVTYAKPEEGRVDDLKQIIKRYKSISLEEMTQLLEFQDTIALQNWLLDLPDNVKFVIDRGYVIIPDELKEETAEAETKINEIAQSLTSLKHFTCFHCGVPLEKNNQFCTDCGKKVLTCSVCKLPIAFGDDVGKCSLCEAKGHLTHLQEWIKVQGKCPVCMQKLSKDDIIQLPSKDSK
ncbi:MAG: hypothetical protein ACTSSH_09420 [Candidatus Heimdallarchaeota archaeon]